MPIPRPRDLFSAAFLDDTQRLHFLATEGVPGGYEDDEDGELEEEEEAAIDRDEELVRLKKLYIPNPDEEEEQQNEDDEYADDGEDDGYSQEAEEERENKLERFRKLIRRKLRRRAIASKLNVLGCIKTGLSHVDMQEYGIMFRCKERLRHEQMKLGRELLRKEEEERQRAEAASGFSSPNMHKSNSFMAGTRSNVASRDSLANIAASHSQRLRNNNMTPEVLGSVVGAYPSVSPLPSGPVTSPNPTADMNLPAVPDKEFSHCESEGGKTMADAALTVHWKPSRRSRYPAYPLHWAVMGRSHGTLRFLIMNGADPSRVVEDDLGLFPEGLTARHIAEANGLHDTLAVLDAAIAAHQEAIQQEESEKQKIESELEQIKAIKERRKMEREQRAADRRAAEEAAAAEEEAEEAAEDDDGDDYDDDED